MWMILFITFIVFQRITELIIAKSNEQWMKERGGIEKGQQHYKWFIYLHIMFFIFLIVEVIYSSHRVEQLNRYLFLLFIVAQVTRVWCIYTLGRFWNTKVIVIPKLAIIKKGPYKYVKHPNYIIVAVELALIPLMFGAYLTALIFPILHIILIRIRVPIEEKALAIK